jgi:hypothetical protein
MRSPLAPTRASRHALRARRLLIAAALALGAFVAIGVGCGPTPLQKERARLALPLAALADSGDVEALRMIADIEVLRADGMFSDSLANTLTDMPATEFFSVDEKAVRSRAGRGADITTLLAYTAAEPMLLKEQVITPEQSSELRRLALDNMTAAAEMAASFGGRGTERAP